MIGTIFGTPKDSSIGPALDPTAPDFTPPATPEQLLATLLEQLASMSGSRWDQWARYHAGDEAAERLIAWLEAHGVRTNRVGSR